jgi:hypothetical protein
MWRKRHMFISMCKSVSRRGASGAGKGKRNWDRGTPPRKGRGSIRLQQPRAPQQYGLGVLRVSAEGQGAEYKVGYSRMCFFSLLAAR